MDRPVDALYTNERCWSFPLWCARQYIGVCICGQWVVLLVYAIAGFRLDPSDARAPDWTTNTYARKHGP